MASVDKKRETVSQAASLAGHSMEWQRGGIAKVYTLTHHIRITDEQKARTELGRIAQELGHNDPPSGLAELLELLDLDLLGAAPLDAGLEVVGSFAGVVL